MNTYSAVPGSTVCLACPLNSAAPALSSACQCVTGTTCKLNYFHFSLAIIFGDVDVLINPSLYSCVTVSGFTGYVINATDSSSSLSCVGCPVGWLFNSSGMCSYCPPGTFSSVVASKECQNCGVNSYASSAGSSGCVACPDNSAAPAASVSCQCLSGI